MSSLPGVTFAAFAQSMAGAVIDLVRRWFGAAMDAGIYGGLQVAHLIAALIFVALILMADAVIFGSLRKWTRRDADPGVHASWWHHIARRIAGPLHLAAWVVGVYFALSPIVVGLSATRETGRAQFILTRIMDCGLLVVVVWLFFRLTRAADARMMQWASQTNSRVDDLLVPLVGKCLRVIVPVTSIILVLPVLELPPTFEAFVGKISSILIIGTISWILFQAVNLVSELVMTRFDIKAANNLRAREVYTQVTVLKKTIYFMILIFTIASVLMLFEEVRRLGTSILASAGVVGIIAGFAAQKTIANLFAGFQLAMTQPIRIDDVVIVEGEWGRIEEITLTYVVVRIWDLRRLVLPISYFIEKPFQNWTRVSADILGTIFLYTDYSVPVDALRQELQRICDQSPKWDKKVCSIQVTDAKERTVEVRALISAADASLAWDLRCEIREKLILFIQKNYPDSLPKTRAVLANNPNPKLLSDLNREGEDPGRERQANDRPADVESRKDS